MTTLHLLSKRFFLTSAAACLLCFAFAANAAEPSPRVKFQTTAGDFTVELYPEKAPKTVANFLQYVQDKHYDGLIFHRVINNFMVQGGGYDSQYQERKTRPPIAHEGQSALAKGGLRNVVGTLAMARTNAPHSASSQFFINVKDNPFLDPVVIPAGDPVPKFEYQGQVFSNVPREQLLNSPQLFGYTVFGKVVAGMDTIQKIKGSPVGAGGPFPSDVPKTPIVIKAAQLIAP